MKPLLNTVLALSLLFITMIGCKNSGKIKESDVNLKLIRFEQELFSADAYSVTDSSSILARKYPDFVPLFSNRIIEIGDTAQPWFGKSLEVFVTDQAIYNIYKRVSEVLPNLDDEMKELKKAFGRYHTLFPDSKIPTVYTYVSGFNQSMVTTEGIIGISLEKYLGTNEPLYLQVYPPIPQYQRYVMYPGKIPTDAMRAWINTEFEYNPEQRNLLSQMIYEGRNMYMLKQLFPEENDSVIWGYTPKQVEFCLESEKQMWTYLVENKLLFINDNFRINQFVEDAPFTKDFTKDSPGRVAVWIGYRIVEKYVQSSNISLPELMKENNYQKILNESRYKP